MSKVLLYSHVFVACLLACPLEAAEEVPEVAPEAAAEDPQNAATHYLHAAEFLPEVTWEERKQIRDALEKLDPDACASLLERDAEAFDKVFEPVALGAKCETCDWGTDYSDWMDTLLPHVSDARLIVSVGYLRTLQLAEEGKWDRVIDLWSNCMTLGRHVSYEPCLVGALVSIREERLGTLVAQELLKRMDDEERRARLHRAWQSLPERRTVHNAASKDHAGMIAWAKRCPGDLLRHVGGSFISGGLAGHVVSTDPPTVLETLQGKLLVQTADWKEIERLAAASVAIGKLPADEVDEANEDLVAQIRGLPKGSTRKIANQLVLAVADARKAECELEQLSESLSQAFQDREE